MTTIENSELKGIVKEALVELLEEKKEVFREILIEVIEDYGMLKAMEEADDSEIVSEEEVFKILKSVK